MRKYTRQVVMMLAVSAAAGFSAAGAWGQIQVQQNGNALDRNPLVGSGGSNTPVPGYVPINGNDIITGNVTGLQYFHAPAGTISPYTFQAPLGTSTLQNFARQSAGGLQTTPPGLSSTYFLPSSTVSTAQGSLYFSPEGSGFRSRLVPSEAASPLGSAPGALPGPVAVGLPIRDFDIGAAAQPNPSAPSEITSPLFVRPPEQLVLPGQKSQPGMPIVPGSAGVHPEQNPNDQNNAIPQPDSVLPPGPGREAPDNGAAGPGGGQLAGNGSTTGGRNANGLRGQEQGMGPGMAVTGTYADLLNEIDRARRAGPGNTRITDTEQNVGANGRNSAVANNNNNNNNIPGQMNALPGGIPGNANTPGMAALPGQATPGSDFANGRSGSETATGGASAGGTGMLALGEQKGYQSVDPTKPNYRPNLLEAPGSTDVTTLAQSPADQLRAGSKVPELKSLAGNAVGAKLTPFDELMKQGEDQMKQGKYLEAADAYQMAVTSEPNNALAILGRGNAELAAGMYESASSDLQFVFTKKPELISVKYALGDYIPVQRQGQLIADLTKLTQLKNTGNMASFLLCYLCYQTGRNDELHAELDRWGSRPWRDQWQVVAEKAWR